MIPQQPGIELLDQQTIDQVLEEAYQLLKEHGVKVQSPRVLSMLAEAGARVDAEREVAYIPRNLVETALETVPRQFDLYDSLGQPSVHYGGDSVHFDPGSCGVHILNPKTLEHQPSTSADLVRIIKVAEMLPQLDAQSTAVVCHDVPKEIGDLYRLFLVLWYSNKPVVTGAFSASTLPFMFELLAISAGGYENLANKPRAVFDVCPSPPLIWSEFGAENLVDLARSRVPAQMVSMPLAGAAAPVTLLGSVVQHAAESLSGIVIHQLTRPGAPIVWGGAPAIFDMRTGVAPMGAIETAMLDVSYAQVGKALGLPTHTYLAASDAKLVDAQAGMESGISALVGALGGVNMISGAGMLDFLACFSVEKLVIDSEAIGMAKRLLKGVTRHTPTLALELFAGIDFKGDFLKQKATRQLFAKEQTLPSAVIDRSSIRSWQQEGSRDTFTRARHRVEELLLAYQDLDIQNDYRQEMRKLVGERAAQVGMLELIGLD